MDRLLIESIAEATDVPLDPLAKARLTADNLAHRIGRAMEARFERTFDWCPCLQKFLNTRRICRASVLSNYPPVFLLPIGGVRPLWMIEALGSHFRKERALFLLLIYWSFENPRAVELLRRDAELHRSRFPNHCLVFLCNTPRELDLLTAAGLNAVAANHNQIVSERTFRPLDDIAVIDCAVYNAKIARFKRHYLAAGIDRVVYIAYRCASDMSRNAGRAYVQRMLSRSPNHHFANPLVDGLPSMLGLEEVNRTYSQASVGLCLSPVEGAMYASIEYLLAGLPIVTTPNCGGRDAFFDPDYCLTVAPDVRAIRDAVVALRDRNIPRSTIRERTLRRLETERQRSRSAIENVIERHGLDLRAPEIWPPCGIENIIFAPVRHHVDRQRGQRTE